MNEQVKISIIIPVFQAELYLERCVNSILSQSYGNFELILVNDGSTDTSGAICNRYQRRDNRIKAIHQTNKGQATARNAGMDLATGEYITFADNDDVVEKDIYCLLIENALKYKTDITACSYYKLPENGCRENIHDYTNNVLIYSNREGMKEILSREKLDIYIWTKLYKHSFLKENAIRFEDGKPDEDILFNFKAYQYAQKTLFLDSPLYQYSVRKDSASRSFDNARFKKGIEGTFYRLEKIYKETAVSYPDLLYLANRQRIIYNFRILDLVVKRGRQGLEKEYARIIRFLKKNKQQIISENPYLGLNRAGLEILFLFPPGLYYFYRRLRYFLKNFKKKEDG